MANTVRGAEKLMFACGKESLCPISPIIGPIPLFRNGSLAFGPNAVLPIVWPVLVMVD